MVGDGVFLRVQAVVGFGEKDVLVQAYAFWIRPGEKRGAGRGAYRTSDHEAGELSSFFCHPVDVRGLDIWRTEATQILVALVICEDDDEIRFRGKGRQRRAENEQGEE